MISEQVNGGKFTKIVHLIDYVLPFKIFPKLNSKNR